MAAIDASVPIGGAIKEEPTHSHRCSGQMGIRDLQRLRSHARGHTHIQTQTNFKDALQSRQRPVHATDSLSLSRPNDSRRQLEAVSRQSSPLVDWPCAESVHGRNHCPQTVRDYLRACCMRVPYGQVRSYQSLSHDEQSQQLVPRDGKHERGPTGCGDVVRRVSIDSQRCRLQDRSYPGTTRQPRRHDVATATGCCHKQNLRGTFAEPSSCDVA